MNLEGTREEKVKKIKDSLAASTPAHYGFSRKFYTGGAKSIDWVGYGFTGKIYYQNYYANCGDCLAEITKDQFDLAMAAFYP